MNDFTTEIKDRFVDKLEKEFRPNTSWEDLLHIANQIEGEIETEIFEGIKKYIETNISNSEFISQRNFKINNIRYELEVQSQFTKTIHKSYDLAIGIQHTIFDKVQKPDMIEKSFNFDNISFGKYSGYSIYLPKSLQNCIEPIQNITSEITRVGYSFYKSIIIEKVRNQIHVNLSERLYNKLRQILENENCLNYNDYIWFVLISNEKGYYLGDSMKITTTINNLVKNRLSYIPSQVVASFFTTILPFEVMNSIRLMNVRRGETLDFEIEKSNYAKNHPDFKNSEEIIHLAKTIAAMMVSKDKNEKLIMSFPIEHNTKIKEIFTEKNITMLSDTFDDCINEVNSKINISNDLYNFSGVAGNFIGSLISGILNLKNP